MPGIPDLIVSTAAKDNSSAAMAAMEKLGLSNVALSASGKSSKRIYRPGISEPRVFPMDPADLNSKRVRRCVAIVLHTYNAKLPLETYLGKASSMNSRHWRKTARQPF